MKFRTYDTPEELWNEAHEYFDKCDRAKKWYNTKKGNSLLPTPKTYSLIDMLNFLEISEDQFNAYFQDTAFMETAQKLEQKIKGSVESSLANGGGHNVHGLKFIMQTQFGLNPEVVINRRNFNVNIDYKQLDKMTIDELQEDLKEKLLHSNNR